MTSYEPPAAPDRGGDAQQPAADGIPAAIPAGVPARLLEAKASMEDGLRLRARGISAQALDGTTNIQGVAIGVGLRRARAQEASAAAPGDPVLTVFLAEPAPTPQVRSVVAASLGVRAETVADEIPVQPVVTGFIDAQAHRMQLRPAPAGISIGHHRVTSGTLGCLAVGRTDPRASRLLVLGNNHVLANCNDAAVGDCVCQPGSYDGGTCETGQIAELERFVPLQFGGPANHVDCATAWAWPERVRRELLQVTGGTPSYFVTSATPVPAQLGMVVGKSGRTTQVTTGQVSAVGASIWVNYAGGRSAYFEDQIVINGSDGDFSRGGDSGSLVWTWDSTRSPVGLLFAGGGPVSFANRLDRVLDALDIDLYAGGSS